MDYNSLTVLQLKQIAREKEIAKYYKMRKHEIIIELEKIRDLEGVKGIERIEKGEKRIIPIKKNPITDAKLELKGIFKKLGRNYKVNKNTFTDSLELGKGTEGEKGKEEKVVYTITANELKVEFKGSIKTFALEKEEGKKMAFWSSVYNYLYNSIYFLGEMLDTVLTFDTDKFLDNEKEEIIFYEFPPVLPLKEEKEEEKGEEKEKEEEEIEGKSVVEAVEVSLPNSKEEPKEEEEKRDEMMVLIQLSSKLLSMDTKGHEGDFALLYEGEESVRGYYKTKEEAKANQVGVGFSLIKQVPQRRLESMVKGRPLYSGRRLPSK